MKTHSTNIKITYSGCIEESIDKFMNENLMNQLLEETIDLAVEDNATETCESFVTFVRDMLPSYVLEELEEINGDATFLEEIWQEKFEIVQTKVGQEDDQELAPGCCLVCENFRRLTRHHVFPRVTHKKLLKKGNHSQDQLQSTISICRMCHSTIHRFFSNDVLADRYHSLELLMADEKFLKYAAWAAKQSKEFRR